MFLPSGFQEVAEAAAVGAAEEAVVVVSEVLVVEVLAAAVLEVAGKERENN